MPMKTTHIPARSEGAFTGRIRWSTQKIGQKAINTIFQKSFYAAGFGGTDRQRPPSMLTYQTASVAKV